MDNPFGMARNAFFMRDHDNRFSFFVQGVKNIHDLCACLAVEISCRFIGKEYIGFINQCAGDGNALLLPS